VLLEARGIRPAGLLLLVTLLAMQTAARRAVLVSLVRRVSVIMPSFLRSAKRDDGANFFRAGVEASDLALGLPAHEKAVGGLGAEAASTARLSWQFAAAASAMTISQSHDTPGSQIDCATPRTHAAPAALWQLSRELQQWKRDNGLLHGRSRRNRQYRVEMAVNERLKPEAEAELLAQPMILAAMNRRKVTSRALGRSD
jgi:hypothetical protein